MAQARTSCTISPRIRMSSSTMLRIHNSSRFATAWDMRSRLGVRNTRRDCLREFVGPSSRINFLQPRPGPVRFRIGIVVGTASYQVLAALVHPTCVVPGGKFDILRGDWIVIDL